MWHEARRQEKQLRARLVDCSKRAERRRKYYDNVRRDPDQFMQIHGRRVTIHTDRNVARAAEDVNVLRKWQGDEDVLIDRFDARSHLEYIAPVTSKHTLTSMEEKEELLCNFERYRLLVMNDFKDISEKAVLKSISEKEFWMSSLNEDTRKSDIERKRKSKDGKSNIGLQYEDTEVVRGGDDDDSSNEEDEDVEELDADIEVHLNSADAQRRVNMIGEGYNVNDSHFVALFRADQQAQKNAAELRRIERQKVRVAGREGKQERQMLKKQRAMIVGRGQCDEATTTLSSLRAKATEKKSLLDYESSSSSSDEEPAKAEFITSFGGDGEAVVKKDKHSKSRHRRRSAERSHTRRRSRSYDRRSRSRDRRSRSRSHDRKKRSRRRSRSHSRGRRRRSRSSDRSSSSTDRPLFKAKKVEPVPLPATEKPSSSSSESGSEELLEIRSSMSESEKERIEIENRKRRVRRTKRMVKANKISKNRDRESDEDDKERAQRVKQKMKKALKKTVEELKEEEEEKKREALREKKVREELNYIEEQERRQRELKRQDERGRERREADRREGDRRDYDRRDRRKSRSRSRSRSPDDHRRRHY